ncbi:unnamed protein product [Phaeothamnion confervicola]
MSVTKTATLGFPRIGPNRELKKALESYWNGQLPEEALLETAASIEEGAWEAQAAAGEEGQGHRADYNLYDQTLLYTESLGLVPDRFVSLPRGIDRMFQMARGGDDRPALDMTKLFDTNYHYNVPELTASHEPAPDFSYLMAGLERGVTRLGGHRSAAVVLGPVTYLHLAKADAPATRVSLLAKLVPVYRALLADIAALSVAELQLHEPALTAGADAASTASLAGLFEAAYPAILDGLPRGLDINMVAYFGEDVGESNLYVVAAAP